MRRTPSKAGRPEPLAAACEKPSPPRGAAELDATWFVRITLLALVLRVVYVLQLRASPWFYDPVMDSSFHHEWAKAFAAGETFIKGAYFRPPLYPWFLGAIYAVFGPNLLIARLVQALLGAVNCGLVYLVGRRAFNRPVGLGAGFIASVYWTIIYFDAELLSPTVIVFLNLLLILALLAARRHGALWRWGLAGVLLGLSAAVRPDILLLGPAIVAWIAWLYGRRWRRTLVCSAAVTAGCLLPILPITVRNYVKSHDVVLLGYYGGVNLYIGNNPGADGMVAVIPEDPAGWAAGLQSQMQRVAKALGRPPSPSEFSDWYVRKTLEYIGANPGAAFGRMLLKLGYFWTRWEIPNNHDIYFVTRTYTPIMRFLPIGFWLVGPLGLLGLLLAFREAKALFPLWSVVLAYMLVTVLFFANARFRIPAVVILCVFAAFALAWIWEAARARRWKRLGGAAAVVALASVLVARIPATADIHMVEGHHYAGVLLADQGRFAEAEPLLKECIRRTASSGIERNPFTWYTLGFVQLQLGRFVEAEKALRTTLEILPERRGVRPLLVLALLGQGRLDEAVAQYEDMPADEPPDQGVAAQLGFALVHAGRESEGRAYVRAALAADPAATAVVITDGVRRLAEGGDWHRARRLAEAAVEAAPGEARCLAALIEILATAPRADVRDVPRAIALGEAAAGGQPARADGAATPASDPAADALVLEALGTAYLAGGQVERARETWRHALATARQTTDTELAQRIELRLKERRHR